MTKASVTHPQPLQEEKRAILIANPKARLFDQAREILRFHHYSLRTERAYLQWIKRFLVFHRRSTSDPSPEENGKGGWRHPKEMGAAEVREFLTHLAVVGNVAASTQNQALNALVFLYGQVLQTSLGNLGEFARVRRPARLPQVLTAEETKQVLAALKPGSSGLIVRLLYGTGMRLIEALRLRVKDLELERGRIVVREGKGDKDRMTLLPQSLKAEPRREQREGIRLLILTLSSLILSCSPRRRNSRGRFSSSG